MKERFLTRIRELKFKQLLVFERVMVLGSMHKAAEALHMSQPNVHKIIGQLEVLIDVPLFERNSKGVTPTAFAECMLERIKPMLGDARALGEELVSLRSGDRGHVVIGTLISASGRLLPDSIALMKSRRPGVDISVREATNNLLFPMLVVGELDLIVGRLPETRGDGVEYHELYEEQLIIVTRSGHPLSERAHFSLHELLDFPWIVPSCESPVRGRLENFFARHRLPEPTNQIESLSMLTNLGILRQTDTIAMLPRAAAQPMIQAGSLSQLAVDEDIKFGTLGYSVRAGRQPTPASRAFIDALKEVAATLSVC